MSPSTSTQATSASKMPALRSSLVLIVLSSVHCENSEGRFAKRAEPFLGRVVSTRAEVSAKVEEILHSDYRADTDDRLKEMQDKMRTTFEALPKTEHGLLGTAATRYLLHRHFRRSRGWLVRGLTPDGNAWNSTMPTALLRDKTPGSVPELFEHRLRGHGLDLPEVALLAAMIENQVHKDTVDRLRKAWFAQRMPLSDKVNVSDAERVLDTYMMGYILHENDYMKPEVVSDALGRVEDVYPKWNSTQAYIRATLRRILPQGVTHSQFSFQDLERVVVDISEHYGRYQMEECKGLKIDLVALEGQRPGRVELRDFFHKAIYEGEYQFGESVQYMRASGLLDETEPSSPSVIVPNYIDSPSQLVANSENYAVSCLDECEELLGKLEQQVAAPYAKPSQIIAVMASLGSPTQSAWGATMPTKLQLRLRAIAAVHGGEVPLHGRLFAQWLHHAYPRECAYPHVAGSTKPMEPEDYNVEEGENAAYASPEEMASYVKSKRTNSSAAQNEELPWDPTEELLAPRAALRVPLLPSFLVPWFHLAGCITVLSLLLPNLSFLQSVSSASKQKSFM